MARTLPLPLLLILILIVLVLIVLVVAPVNAQTVRRSRWDLSPEDLPHLQSTSPEQRERIDTLVKTMLDPNAGRDSLDAKMGLILIGKPAFPRILGAMVAVRDRLTETDSGEARLVLSGLKLGDEALREMDGYLTSHHKPVLRPGSGKEYVSYILRLHGKRWVKVLRDLPEMPGPFDPGLVPEVHAVGVMRGAAVDGSKRTTVTVHVRRKSVRMILVLSAYEAVDWTVVAGPGVRLERVVASGYFAPRVSGLPEGVPLVTSSHEDGDDDGWFHCHEKPLDGDEISAIGRRVQEHWNDFLDSVRIVTGAELTTFRGAFERDAFLIR